MSMFISGSSTSTGSFGHLTTDSSIGIGTTNVRSALTIKEGVLGGNAEIRFDDTDDTLLGKIGVARTTNEIINGTANLDLAIRLYDQNSDIVIGKGATEVARIDGMNGSYSGSAASTGSFGHLNIVGPGDNVANFQAGNRTLSLKLNDSAPSGDVGVQFRAGASDYLGLAAGGGSDYGIVIHSNNNVAIGHEDPEGKLHIYSGDAGGSSAIFNQADELVIENSNHAGITIKSPNDKETSVFLEMQMIVQEVV